MDLVFGALAAEEERHAKSDWLRQPWAFEGQFVGENKEQPFLWTI